MAYATGITLSTGNKVSLHDQSQEVSVTLTYQLEREDTDVLAVVQEKTAELAQAHRTAWQTLRDAKVAAVQERAEAAPISTALHQEMATTPVQSAEPVPAESFPMTDAGDTNYSATATADRITPGQRAALLLLLMEGRWSEERRQDYMRDQFSCDSVDDLSAEQAQQWLLQLQRAEREQTQNQRLQAARLNGK